MFPSILALPVNFRFDPLMSPVEVIEPADTEESTATEFNDA